jgi:hypothetical protein
VRAQAERNADLVRRQREMEKSRERRDFEQELARARVGGVSAESLLAGADRFSLSSSQKDWLTGSRPRTSWTGRASGPGHRQPAASLRGPGQEHPQRSNLSLLQSGANASAAWPGRFRSTTWAWETEDPDPVTRRNRANSAISAQEEPMPTIPMPCRIPAPARAGGRQ